MLTKTLLNLFFFILYPNSGRINMVKYLAVNFLFLQLAVIILQSIKFRNYYISICIYVSPSDKSYIINDLFSWNLFP